MTLDKEKSKMWAEIENKNGHSFGKEFKDSIEDKFGNSLDMYDDESEYLKDFRDYTLEMTQLVQLGITSAKHTTSIKSPSKFQKAEKGYDKPFNRRCYLVQFIIDSWARSCNPRIDWEKVTAEWNETHPHDIFNNTKSIKSLYNQAIRQWEVIEVILLRQIREALETNPETTEKCISRLADDYNSKYGDKASERLEKWGGTTIIDLWQRLFEQNRWDMYSYKHFITGVLLHNCLFRLFPWYRKDIVDEDGNIIPVTPVAITPYGASYIKVNSELRQFLSKKEIQNERSHSQEIQE